MRRFWYAKYAVTLLVSVALTFHLLHMDIIGDAKKNSHISDSVEPNEIPNSQEPYVFTKSSSFLRRKLSQGSLGTTPDPRIPPRWVVLPGNITIHEGVDPSPNYISFPINSENACSDFTHHKSKLLIFVASSVAHFEKRQAIRETWGLKQLQQAYNFRIVFLLGLQNESLQPAVEREEYRYGDVVQMNLTESFRNLGRKSVSGLQWTERYCKEADFIMKTDDDILVHIPNLLEALQGAKNTDPLLVCHQNRWRQILRKELLDQESIPPNYHKYEVSENELPGKFYPPYCSGMAYVFSRSVRDWLLEASASTPVFFIEDVYLTGFCRHKAGIVIRPHSGITLRPPIDFHQASCSFRDGRITSQEVGVDELRKLWVELNTRGFFCPQLLGYAKIRKESAK